MFYELEKLHEGSIATGDLNFTSTEPGPSELQPQPTENVNCIDVDAPSARSNPLFANMGENRASNEPIDLEEIETPTSSCSGHKGNGTGKKRKLSVAGVLQDYVELRAKQTKTFMDELDKITKPMSEYSIKSCLDILESIEDLSDEEKARATNVLRCEVSREIFVNFKNPRVRLLWIKGEIAPKG